MNGKATAFLVVTAAAIVTALIMIKRRKKKAVNYRSSENLLNKIQQFEGFRPLPYMDGGRYSIGYGHQIQPDEQYLMQGISTEQGRDLLSKDLAKYEAAVDTLVTVPINQNQFDSLVDFAYNMGIGALQGSTLLRLVNSNAPTSDIVAEFIKWNHANGTVVAGLTNRRAWEANNYTA